MAHHLVIIMNLHVISVLNISLLQYMEWETERKVTMMIPTCVI